MSVIILGDGQLGSCIRELTGWDYASRKKDGFDIECPMHFNCFLKDYDTVLNCVGFTDTYSDDREEHWNVNYQGVADLVDYCNDYHHDKPKKLVHISTDYVYSNSVSNASEDDVPVHCGNWYGYTKLLGDGYVQLKCQEYLIVRTSFKPYPFPYPKAFVNQLGNFDYTDVIGEKIVQLIRGYAQGVYNVGTESKNIYDLAKQSNPDVEPIDKKIHFTMPTDITMNCKKMNEFLGREI